MTARELIRHAAHKAALCEAGDEPGQLMTFGFNALNRLYFWMWGQYPFRENKLFDLVIDPVKADVVLPVDVDAIRSVVRATGRREVPCMNPIDVERRNPATGGELVGYMNLPDSPVERTVNEAVAAITAAMQKADTRGAVAIRSLVEGGAAKIVAAKQHRFHTLAEEMSIEEAKAALDGAARLTLDKEGCSAQVWAEAVGENGVTYESTIAVFSGQFSVYRAIRLVGALEPIRIHGTRRFMPLLSLDESLQLPRLETAAFDYLMAEFYDFAGKGDAAQIERAKANDELKAVISYQEEVDTEDRSETPERSLFSMW